MVDGIFMVVYMVWLTTFGGWYLYGRLHGMANNGRWYLYGRLHGMVNNGGCYLYGRLHGIVNNGGWYLHGRLQWTLVEYLISVFLVVVVGAQLGNGRIADEFRKLLPLKKRCLWLNSGIVEL